MKKILMILCFILLCGCQQNEIGTDHKTNIQKENLTMKDRRYTTYGDGNDKGFYRIHNDGENSRLAYCDYQTYQEVYLCKQSGCEHKDENCTSYLSPFDSMSSLFVYGNHLYMMNSTGSMEINALGESQRTGPQMTKMDLDGQNRQVLYHCQDGYHFVDTNCAFDSQYVYVIMGKEKEYKMNGDNTIVTDEARGLYRIHLESGKCEKVCDAPDMMIAGVDGRKLILEGFDYPENITEYLEQGNTQKYDEICMNAKTIFTSVDVDTKDMYRVSQKFDDYDLCDGKKIYYRDGEKLNMYDIKTQEIKTLMSLPQNHQYYFSDIVDDYIVLMEYDDENEVYSHMYAIDVHSPKMIELHHYTRKPTEAVTILAQMHDNLLVQYDRIGHDEKTWAGTMQFEVDKTFIGCISKKDFLNDQNEYQTIKQIGD